MVYILTVQHKHNDLMASQLKEYCVTLVTLT